MAASHLANMASTSYCQTNKAPPCLRNFTIKGKRETIKSAFTNLYNFAVKISMWKKDLIERIIMM
jgi:hypothetical protein